MRLFFMIALFAENLAGGKIAFEGEVFSKILNTNRTIRIYLPPSYDAAKRKRYPVLYLHDGQNVFSTAGDHAAFGWGSWQIDWTVDRLVSEGRMREIIMVAVDNTRERYSEYRGPSRQPERKNRRQRQDDPTRFELYAAFLIEELKPRIDREYRTLKGAANTAVMGSSLGGICSLALAWEHPKVFGGAASLSGSFQIDKRYFLTEVLQAAKRRSKPFKVYLDSGTIDYTGDDDGRKNTAEVAAELKRIGWKEGKNLIHFVDETPLKEPELAEIGLRRDKWKEAQKSQHNEFYWRLRAWRPLVFLFPPQ